MYRFPLASLFSIAAMWAAATSHTHQSQKLHNNMVHPGTLRQVVGVTVEFGIHRSVINFA